MAFVPFSFSRARIIDALTSASPTAVDAIPDGFNNSVRWNAGHVIVISDRILHHADAYEHTIPAQFESFFDMDTKPADWINSPPSVEQIKEVSAAQIEAAQQLFQAERDTPLQNPFHLRGTTFQTPSELIGFLTYHEGLHFQTIKLLLMKAT